MYKYGLSNHSHRLVKSQIGGHFFAGIRLGQAMFAGK